MPDVTPVHLPRIFEACDGAGPWTQPNRDTGLLLRETSLVALHRHVDRGYPVAVDIDSIEGLADDETASEYLVTRLGFRVVMTRNPTTAVHVAALGAISFLRVYAVDGTGLAGALRRHPRSAGVGSAISPGLVLPHLRPEELEPLPRPLLAYGLLERLEDMAACLARADAIVLHARALEVALAHGLPAAFDAGSRASVGRATPGPSGP